MCESVPPLEKPMCVDACTFGALTYEEREAVETEKEEVKRGELEIAYEALIKKHGRKKVIDTFSRLSKS
jgi:benzoyl-CoA reductase subunit BamC